MIWERLFITMFLVVIGLGAYLIFKQLHLCRLNQVTINADQPKVLYFRSDGCAVCPTQARYLDQVTRAWNGRIAIEKIDADIEQEKAASFNVFTLPTTILVDDRGVVQEVNYGLANPNKLLRQLQSLM